MVFGVDFGEELEINFPDFCDDAEVFMGFVGEGEGDSEGGEVGEGGE